MYLSLKKLFSFQHGIKKFRNGLLSSGSNGTRLLQKDGNDITWQQLITVYKWDVNANSVRYYEKLSDAHFFLDTSAKMRNHLAEEVLNKRMLQLVREHVKCVPNSEAELIGLIDVLEQTSVIVDIFSDPRPIRTETDERLVQLKNFLSWLKQWESSSTDKKQLLSQECRRDWASTILAFEEMVRNILKDYPEAEIIPSKFNQDLLENTFGCQRSLIAGAGSNPTVAQYCKTINTITLCTNSVPGKCNAGKDTTALPFDFHCPAATFSKLQK